MTARPWKWRDPNRSPRRQRLVKKLISCGERPVLEALIHVASGAPLDPTLEAFCSLAPEDYAAAGADVLAIDKWALIEGGRR